MKQDMPERAARTVLAFDFGLKRIGVAVGEPELGTAHPLAPIAAPGFDAIGRLVKEWQPAQLVVQERWHEKHVILSLPCAYPAAPAPHFPSRPAAPECMSFARAAFSLYFGFPGVTVSFTSVISHSRSG